MPGCRPFPASGLALARLESPPPDLEAVPLCHAGLDLAGRSASVSARVQAPPQGIRPLSFLAASEPKRLAASPRSPVDDRRRCRVLCWGAGCEAALGPV